MMKVSTLFYTDRYQSLFQCLPDWGKNKSVHVSGLLRWFTASSSSSIRFCMRFLKVVRGRFRGHLSVAMCL